MPIEERITLDPAETVAEAAGLFVDRKMPVSSLAAPAAPPAPPAPVVARAPASVEGCSFRWVPKDMHASVIVIPKEYAGRFMVPLFDALCACSRPGDHLAVSGFINTGDGTIRAGTFARPDEGISADAGVDMCLSTFLTNTRFESFGIPSDVVCTPEPEPQAKADNKPSDMPISFFKPARRPGCEPATGGRITYPVLLDRRSELVSTPAL